MNTDRALTIVAILIGLWPICQPLKRKWDLRSRRSVEKALKQIESPDYFAIQQNWMFRCFGAAIYCIAAYLFFATFNNPISPFARGLFSFLGMIAAAAGTALVPITAAQKAKRRDNLMSKLKSKSHRNDAV